MARRQYDQIYASLVHRLSGSHESKDYVKRLWRERRLTGSYQGLFPLLSSVLPIKIVQRNVAFQRRNDGMQMETTAPPRDPHGPSDDRTGTAHRAGFWPRVTAIVRRLISDESGGP